ncbi:MAG: RdgB/HAM1 family non-canonical purine NTP pyrophosphatase [Flavobacteriia bacterium]|jgi:XTP/dITP diphosphohydrolase|nr:MAG: RdgB/HAM1 family non-canonical purine NTP pyrophosphatase [Flavobacteriia bacterium]
MKIVFASHNQKKAAEIRSVLPSGMILLTLHDLELHEEIPEDEPTIEGNSAFKANWVLQRFGLPCFADDTGLEVSALNGAPGVHSARYAGPARSDDANMDKLLRALANESDRSAQFKTVMTYCDGEIEQQFTGLVKGVIATEKLGAEGFGYDPIFVPEDQQLTFAQMPLAQKNLYSHRARAMAQFLAFLKTKAL